MSVGDVNLFVWHQLFDKSSFPFQVFQRMGHLSISLDKLRDGELDIQADGFRAQKTGLAVAEGSTICFLFQEGFLVMAFLQESDSFRVFRWCQTTREVTGSSLRVPSFQS